MRYATDSARAPNRRDSQHALAFGIHTEWSCCDVPGVARSHPATTQTHRSGRRRTPVSCRKPPKSGSGPIFGEFCEFPEFGRILANSAEFGGPAGPPRIGQIWPILDPGRGPRFGPQNGPHPGSDQTHTTRQNPRYTKGIPLPIIRWMIGNDHCMIIRV